MLNINNWVDQSFAQSYQILCTFHYSNQAIHYFVHQGIPSPNNSVVMEETKSSVFKVTQETPSDKEKILRRKIHRYIIRFESFCNMWYTVIT